MFMCFRQGLLQFLVFVDVFVVRSLTCVGRSRDPEMSSSGKVTMACLKTKISKKAGDRFRLGYNGST